MTSLAFPIKVNYLADLLRKASLSIKVHMGFHYNISHSWLKNIKTNFIQSYRLKRAALLCPSFDFIFLVDFNKTWLIFIISGKYFYKPGLVESTLYREIKRGIFLNSSNSVLKIPKVITVCLNYIWMTEKSTSVR